MKQHRAPWLIAAQQRLIDRRTEDAGWSYRDAGVTATEPTALASLALVSLNPESQSSLDAAYHAADWLVRVQRSDGAVGLSAEMKQPEWPTPYALLLWGVLGRYAPATEKAKSWLLNHQGLTFEKPPGSPLGHDTTIPGWSWVEETHSWLEPTAISVLALRRLGQAQHPRVQQGVSLIVNRAIPDGGWNFGNNIAFGRALRPKPAPTGMALLALSGMVKEEVAIERAIAYLVDELPKVRSALSLGYGLLGLTAWGKRPTAADDWLEEAWERLAPRTDSALGASLLIMASTVRTISLLGLPARPGDIHG